MNKQINFKKFILFFLIIIILFITYHLIIWSLYTSKIFERDDRLYIGDLGRMSYQVDSLHPRKLEYTLEKKHLNHNIDKSIPFNGQIDILTIGDSFSNADMGGLNPYYQDYLATRYNTNILNIRKLTHNEYNLFELILTLYNNGYLEKSRPNAIIIESAQRWVYNRFAKNFNFGTNSLNTDSMIEEIKTKDSYIPKLLPINTANYKFIHYSTLYKIKSRALKNVVKLKLNKNLFTPLKFQNLLLFHYYDILSIKNNKEKVQKINNNFNKLAIILKTLNIKLFFMPAVDKYDLYYNYIVDNPYPKNNFFEMIRPLEKKYYFVDTKAILSPLLAQGIKDIYYADDTHWSYKASETIVKDKIFNDNL